MQKWNTGKIGFIVFFATFIFISLYAIAYGETGNPEAETEDYTGILRFHVVANSDDIHDQMLKLKVRDALLSMINQELVLETMRSHSTEQGHRASLTKAQVVDYIDKNLYRIAAEAKSVISKENEDYQVSAGIEKCFIPEKTYGDVVFPAGNYEALRIEIGEAKGENWWCVLFPPLCIIDPEGDSLEALQIGEEDNTIKLKFKTKEFLDGLIDQEKEKSLTNVDDTEHVTGKAAITKGVTEKYSQ